PGFDQSRPKFYVLDMFPYPSGAGLHVGHPEGYTATDILARFKRMCGYNVLHPMGYDAFGLPAEQYAVETGVHPAITTKRNIDNIRRQIKRFGFSYDWDRELTTTDPEYYRWTQWIFRLMFESWFDPDARGWDQNGRPYRGKARPIAELVQELEAGRVNVSHDLNTVTAKRTLVSNLTKWSELNDSQKREVINRQRLAFMDEVPVNWCPKLGTVLANEEVTSEGRSDRGDHPVFRRPLRQWMLDITHYADRLERDLDDLDWPMPIKLMQRNWIGRSEGAEVVFPLADKWTYDHGTIESPAGENPEDLFRSENAIRVYTTRPDTLFGATYMVLSPEHPLLERLTVPEQREAVRNYVEQAANKTELERTAESKDKTGVATGAYAINPVNGERVPVWVADYVLMTYGTGAIMAVPAGDNRDFEFAKKYHLPVRAVVGPPVNWLQDQVIKLGVDKAHAAATGRLDVADSFEQSVHDFTQDATQPPRDGEESWVVQIVGPLHREHPDLFHEAFEGEGVAIYSPDREVGDTCVLNGLTTAAAKKKIIAWLEERGLGCGKVNYKLRDWLFSRQRYWGEPFPILHGPDGSIESVPESELPVLLPEMNDFTPLAGQDADSAPEPPLSRAKDWVCVERIGSDGHPLQFRRELNTMPQWAGSCWYYLRFLSPHDENYAVNPKAEKYWMPADVYVGGAEHAVLHLLYARFWHKFLYDRGYVSTVEPFKRLFNQGMIRSYAYRDSRGVYVPYEDIEFRENQIGGRSIPHHKTTGEVLSESVEKMSKSLKNVVNPDRVIEEFGADTFRLYEMYMGPLESSKPWNTRDLPGLYRFLGRVWRLVVDEETGQVSSAVKDVEPDEETLRLLHRTIREVTEDTEVFKFNTAIAEMFKFVNVMTPAEVRPRSVIRSFLLLLSPYAPHIVEELWQRLEGREWRETVAYESWPAFDPQLAEEDEVEIAIQINGKVRSRITLRADADESLMRASALADRKIAAELASRKVRFIKCVPGRLVNIVAT
ncbi:MAG: class I tRNA ligase family protein, partial [Planctomycetota bacterium]|nr:class I tRNA ligase family protein [Planctomycetota bacterium]